MSSSFSLFLPPISDRLRLWPIPPRARSGDQSPDRSGILAVCALNLGEKAVTATTSTAADITRRFRISRLPLPSGYFGCPLYFGAGAGAAAGARGAPYAVSSLP